MKAIETTGTIDSEYHLILDKPLADINPGRVRIIILQPDETELSESEWLLAATSNPAFDFLKDEAENIYTPSDGKPFHDQR